MGGPGHLRGGRAALCAADAARHRHGQGRRRPRLRPHLRRTDLPQHELGHHRGRIIGMIL